jgi:transposase
MEVDMDLVEYKFNPEEIEKLKNYRDNQKDGRLKIRFIALFMIAKGNDLTEIAQGIGKSPKTVKNWFAQYVTKGIDSLNSFQYKPKKTFLDDEQVAQLISWVRETNPARTKEVKEHIEKNFNVGYSLEAVRQLLIKNGLKVLKPKVVPGNPPSEEDQKKTVEHYFEMKSSCEPGTVFLFGDGMHLIHQNVPGQCWGDPKFPPEIQTNTGRQRLNILGAYNPDTHSFVHLTGEENCDAERVIDFFEVILKAYKRAPHIILILDNAKYFKAKIVREWLEDHPKLQLNFLPAYAPNLNLIERFWRFVKEKLVKNKYYKKYKTFRAKSFQLLNHVDKYVDELRTLMVEKFEIIKYNA